MPHYRRQQTLPKKTIAVFLDIILESHQLWIGKNKLTGPQLFVIFCKLFDKNVSLFFCMRNSTILSCIMCSISLQRMLVRAIGLKFLLSVAGFFGLSIGKIIDVFHILGSLPDSHGMLKMFSRNFFAFFP